MSDHQRRWIQLRSKKKLVNELNGISKDHREKIPGSGPLGQLR